VDEANRTNVSRAFFPAPELEEDVAAYLTGLIFSGQVRGMFPRFSGQTFESAGLPGHGVVIHFDERKQEDEAFRIAISKDQIAPREPAS
jgi:hypothetical protein